jgi:hypothetical protein
MAGKWMELEIITLNEIRQFAKTSITHFPSFWDPRRKQNKTNEQQ